MDYGDVGGATRVSAFNQWIYDTIVAEEPAFVPEPSSLAALLGMGLMGLAGWGWRKRKAA